MSGGDLMETTTHQFKRKPFVKKFENDLQSKVGDGFDVQEIKDFKSTVEEEDLSNRLVAWRKKNPIRNFALCYCGPVGTILLILTILGISQSPTFGKWQVSIPSLFCLMGLLFLTKSGKGSISKIKAIPWQEQPFAEFNEEYPNDVAAKVCCCLESGCSNSNVILTVESHPFSDTRFLLGEHWSDKETQYYLDHWKKPSPNL